MEIVIDSQLGESKYLSTIDLDSNVSYCGTQKLMQQVEFCSQFSQKDLGFSQPGWHIFVVEDTDGITSEQL